MRILTLAKVPSLSRLRSIKACSAFFGNPPKIRAPSSTSLFYPLLADQEDRVIEVWEKACGLPDKKRRKGDRNMESVPASAIEEAIRSAAEEEDANEVEQSEERTRSSPRKRKIANADADTIVAEEEEDTNEVEQSEERTQSSPRKRKIADADADTIVAEEASKAGEGEEEREATRESEASEAEAETETFTIERLREALDEYKENAKRIRKIMKKMNKDKALSTRDLKFLRDHVS